LRFEFLGLDPEEQDQLADEVWVFNRVCLALCKVISGTVVP